MREREISGKSVVILTKNKIYFVSILRLTVTSLFTKITAK